MKLFKFVVILTVIINYGAVAAPEPAIVQKPGNWTLEVKFEQPEQIVLPFPGNHQRYWYIILTLTNQTAKDVDFYPQCDMVTDTLEVIPAIKGTSAMLFSRIKNRHQGKYPFLELIENSDDKILQGRDNTKDVVVIWPDFNPDAKTIHIFISGLSNETAAIDSPTGKDKDGNPEKIYLRKTLQLTYSIAGDPSFRSEQKLKFKEKNWVMR